MTTQPTVCTLLHLTLNHLCFFAVEYTAFFIPLLPFPFISHITYQGGHKPGKPGILRDFSEHGKLKEFSGNSVQPQGKIVTNTIFSSSGLVVWSECCKLSQHC